MSIGRLWNLGRYRPWRSWLGYPVALLVMAVAFEAKVRFGAYLTYPFILAYPTVFVIAFVAGAGPAILSTVVSVLYIAWGLQDPHGEMRFQHPYDHVSLAIFALTGVALALSVGRFRRNRDEARMRARELQTVLDAAPVAIFIARDRKGSRIEANPFGAALLGVDPDANVSLTPAPGSPSPGYRILKEGVEVPGEELPMQVAATTGREVIDYEYDMVLEGGRSRHLVGNASPLLGLDGKPVGAVGAFLDVTTPRFLQEQGAQGSRLAAMGTLVAAVANEINNPLVGILANAGTLTEEVREIRDALQDGRPVDPAELRARSDRALGTLAEVSAGAVRIARVAKDLSIFGRPDHQRKRIRALDVVKRALERVPAASAGAVDVKLVVNDPVPDLVASDGQMERALVNLMTNAVQALPEGGRGLLEIRLGRAQAGWLRIEVIDTGVGMSPEVLGQAFDPFFTTRPGDEVTGMGLTVARAIVTANGGRLTVTSELGKGSSFRIELPPAPAEA